MLLTADPSAASFAPCPPGTYLASLRRIVDLGSQPATFEGRTEHVRRLLLTWEVLDPEVRTADGQPFLVSKRFRRSLHEKSQLRALLTAWRGRDFTPKELATGFDLRAVLGRPCLLAVVAGERDGRSFANVGGVMRAAKGMTGAEPSEPLVHFDLDVPDWTVFDTLGERLKAQIAASPEYAAARRGQAAAAPVAPPRAAAGAASAGSLPAAPPPAAAAPRPATALPMADLEDDIPY